MTRIGKNIGEYSAQEQWALRNVICPEANDAFVDYFLRICAAREIDPFSGLLYLQLRTSKGVVKPVVAMTIDGARAQAGRTGQYAGSDDYEFDNEDAETPMWARATVWRQVKGSRYSFTAKVRWREYCPKPGKDHVWRDKPYHMLGKCAEMQALRKAFPEAVFDQSDHAMEQEEEAAPPTLRDTDKEGAVPPGKWLNILKAFDVHGVKGESILQRMGVVTFSELTEEHADQITKWYVELQKAGLGAKPAVDEPPPPQEEEVGAALLGGGA